MKTKIKNRVLAILTAFVMVFGVAEGFLVRAVDAASEVTTVDMRDYNFAVRTGDTTNLHLIVGSEELNDLVAYANVFVAADENSGIWTGTTGDISQDTRRSELEFRKIENNTWYRIGSSANPINATEGMYLTIKGNFMANSIKVVLPEMQFQYTSSGWKLIKIYDLRDYNFAVRMGDTTNLHLIVGSEELNDLVAYANAFVAADENSGIWTGTTGDVSQDTRRSELEFRKIENNTWYRIGSNALPINATEGMYLTIKGNFMANSIKVVLPEMQFRYTGGQWKKVVTYDLTDYSFDVRDGQLTTSDRLHLKVKDNMTNELVGYQDIFVAVDENSGIWIGNTGDISQDVRQANMPFLKTDAPGIYYRIGNADYPVIITEDQYLTIKGTFVAGCKKVVLPEMQFQYTSSGWVRCAIGTVVVDMSEATFALNSNSNTTYVYTEVTNVAENATKVKGQGIFSAANDESGVWLGETKLDASVGVAYTSDGYWRIGLSGTTLGTEVGTILTVKGTFEKVINYVKYQIVMPELQFQYTATGWVKYVSTITIDMTAANFALNRNSGKNYVFTEVTNAAENAASIKGQGVFSAANAESGVWLGETKLDASVGVAYTSDGYWRIGNGTEFGAVEGSVLTVKGTFAKTLGDGNYEIIMPELKFEYTTAGWAKYLPTVTVDVREVTFALNVNSNPSYIYMEAKNIPENAGAIKGQGVFSAADTASGVWVGETKLAEGIGFAYTSDGYWRIGNGTAFGAEEGSVLTAKGSFIKTIEDANYEIIIPEMKFQYTGSGWVSYCEDGDYNDDYKVDVRDLVRLKRYQKDSTIAINNSAFFEEDNMNIDNELTYLYSKLLGGYATGLNLARMAYSCPETGT